jgi:hypothetical protein
MTWRESRLSPVFHRQGSRHGRDLRVSGLIPVRVAFASSFQRSLRSLRHPIPVQGVGILDVSHAMAKAWMVDRGVDGEPRRR